MTYPKPVMRLSELKAMGFNEEWLRAVARKRNQKIAWQTSNKKNSPWMFDTEELERVRRASCVGRF